MQKKEEKDEIVRLNGEAFILWNLNSEFHSFTHIKNPCWFRPGGSGLGGVDLNHPLVCL